MSGKPKRYWSTLALFTLFTLLLATVAIGLWLARQRAMILVHPGRSLPTRTPADYRVPRWEDVRFSSADGLELGGWFIPPDPAGDGATLLFVHGLGGNRGEFVAEAAMLASHGYGALLIDLRNHGQSQGTVTTMGYAEVQDAQGALAYLATRPEVKLEHIGLVGNSMGGAVVIRAAARIPTVRVVVAQSTFTSLEDNLGEGVQTLTGLPAFPFAPAVVWFAERESGVNIRQARPIDDAPRIAPRAILFIHGEQDPIMRASNSMRLYQAAREPKELYLIPKGGHGELLKADPAEYERRVVSFLDKYLRGR